MKDGQICVIQEDIPHVIPLSKLGKPQIALLKDIETSTILVW